MSSQPTYEIPGLAIEYADEPEPRPAKPKRVREPYDPAAEPCLTEADTYLKLLDIRRLVYRSDWADLRSELQQFKPAQEFGGEPRSLPCVVIVGWLGSPASGAWHFAFVGVEDLEDLTRLGVDAKAAGEPDEVEVQYRQDVALHTGKHVRRKIGRPRGRPSSRIEVRVSKEVASADSIEKAARQDRQPGKARPRGQRHAQAVDFGDPRRGEKSADPRPEDEDQQDE